VEESV
jgi:hypothetical protein